MAKKSKIIQAQRAPKFEVRQVNRCRICGRPVAICAAFRCAVCFRKLANEGQIPGVKKASW